MCPAIPFAVAQTEFKETIMNRRISLRHLRCFIAVAEAESFTVAASRLFLTQSSLTTTIQQFEDLVGLKLFDRNTRRVVMRSEEHTSELQSLMSISYAVFCLKKKNHYTCINHH